MIFPKIKKEVLLTMKVLINLRWLKVKTTKYVEYGLDPDNNRFLFGVSSEEELEDGTEYRTPDRIPLKIKELYIRIWLFKMVFCIGTSGISLKIKDRNNCKFIFGLGGI